MSRAGFQLSARFEAGKSAGTSAGTLRSIDQLTETVRDGNDQVTYVQHTKTIRNIGGGLVRLTEI